jgi:hypothetical protein
MIAPLLADLTPAESGSAHHGIDERRSALEGVDRDRS